MIERMLNSVYQYIDYWVIQDNGSTDGTQDIIRNFFEEKEIPGYLYQLDWWKGHGINRDHCIKTALSSDHGCDWILRVDADEQLQVDDGFDWSIFDDTSIQSFNVPCASGDISYFRTWIWNAREPWAFYPEKAHETIYLDRDDIGEGFQRVNLPRSFRHYLTNDGQTWLQPMKFLKDALNLELDVVPNSKVLEDNYHLWYIAKSYFDTLGDDFPFGLVHRDEYARRSMFYFKQYIFKKNPRYEDEKIISECDDELAYCAAYFIGEIYRVLGKVEDAITWHNEASRFCEARNESYYELANIHRDRGDYLQMHQATCMLVDEDRSNPFPNKQFLIFNWAYCDTSDKPMQLHNEAITHLE